MTRTRRLLALCFIAVGALLTSAPAHAYCDTWAYVRCMNNCNAMQDKCIQEIWDQSCITEANICAERCQAACMPFLAAPPREPDPR